MTATTVAVAVADSPASAPPPPIEPAISRSQRLFLPGTSREPPPVWRNPEAVDSLQTLVVPHADTLVLGRYRLRERLGAGGFGVVWSAYDEQLHREVAVKRIWLQTDRVQGAAERATREAQATARLSHPAIVALYEAQAEGDAFYLISELVRGDTLGAMLADGELCDEEVLAIGVALASALEHAHARGVVHRDVKPHNILVPYEEIEHAVGAAKLTDFGGALLAGEDVLTRTGDVLGTLAYMAPEQSEGREATPYTDLYSLALVLYEALSGINPVRGANPADTARRIGGSLPPLRRYRRDLPPDLCAAVDRALASNPQRRGTLPALRQTLETLLEQGLAESPPRAHTPHLTQPHSAQPRPAPLPPQPVPEREPVSHRLLLPRTLWVLVALALVVWQSVSGQLGTALLALAAMVPLLILRRTPLGALAGLLAPSLGAVGLAGVFPAIAGQARGWGERAALGALGYWWLCLAEPLLGKRLWLGPPYVPPLSTGVLLGAALWACAALLLPWLVRGCHAALDLVVATIWTAALFTAEPLLDHGLPLLPGQALPRGALLAAILAGALAVGARALRGPI
ncbi:MAG TPA: serine/threonine-protein kinase [Solirubrobacteraceae bacterium]|nr:serine/threonine-protein kinase [Solirubrobacteraceae bacterium]